MLGYDDKRDFFRMMMNAPCEVTIHDEESALTVQAVCKDMSAAGMAFEIEEQSVGLGTQVEVAIESTSSQIPSLAAKGKVVRCDAVSDTSCTIGVEITEMV